MPASKLTSATVPPRPPTEEAGGVRNWRHSAARRDEDPEVFFPIGATGPAAWQAEAAKTVCRRCPALNECLAWALAAGVEHGVWGGHTEEERRSLRRRRARGRTSRRLI